MVKTLNHKQGSAPGSGDMVSPEQRYDTVLARAQQIPGDMGLGIVRLYTEERARMLLAPGSRQAHQAWPGGYVAHIDDMLSIASVTHQALSAHVRALPFPVSDAYAAILLHDIEKPWKYAATNQAPLNTKDERQQFRKHLLVRYGIPLSASVANAVLYAEGEFDYVPGERKMQPLAGFVHACDILSARTFPEDPR